MNKDKVVPTHLFGIPVERGEFGFGVKMDPGLNIVCTENPLSFSGGWDIAVYSRLKKHPIVECKNIYVPEPVDVSKEVALRKVIEDAIEDAFKDQQKLLDGVSSSFKSECVSGTPAEITMFGITATPVNVTKLEGHKDSWILTVVPLDTSKHNMNWWSTVHVTLRNADNHFVEIDQGPISEVEANLRESFLRQAKGMTRSLEALTSLIGEVSK